MSYSILVVDDNEATRTIIKAVMKNAGFTVATASDGAEALAQTNRDFFDLVITDYDMPNMDGIEFTSELRLLDPYRFTPVVMLTAQTGPKIRQRGDEAGVNVWLMKPLNPTKLLELVKQLASISESKYHQVSND